MFQNKLINYCLNLVLSYKNMNYFVYASIIVVTCLLNGNAAEYQLKQLNILFRHGDRTPTVKGAYANDPYLSSGFYPIGFGALTNRGKLRAYELGENLRKRYKNFLGDVYLPELLYARSTDYDRTKMTLQLVLAALFPPSNLQRWHDTLNWQPIPTTALPKSIDDLLATVYQPQFIIEKKRVGQQKDIQERLNNLRPFMSELSNLTGNEISNTMDIKNIYDTLVAEASMNLTLPNWANEFLSNGKLLEGTHLDYDMCSYDNNIIKVLVGKVMAKITRDVLQAIDVNNKTLKKLYLYSAHDVNVLGVLRSLKVYKTHEPEYTSAVIFELLEEMGKYFIRILYYQGIPAEIIELEIPGCSVVCPLEKYLVLTNDILDSNLSDLSII